MRKLRSQSSQPVAQDNALPVSPLIRAGDELTIIVRPHDASICKYIGTRAQLEAEGVIPPGTDWPERNQKTLWRNGEILFCLSRVRRKAIAGDNECRIYIDQWCLRMELHNGLSGFDDAIARKKKELQAMIYAGSAKGMAESNKRFRQYIAAQDDTAFTAFKASIPCLTSSPRRKSARSVSAQAKHSERQHD
jgi:hypothetical protein